MCRSRSLAVGITVSLGFACAVVDSHDQLWVSNEGGEALCSAAISPASEAVRWKETAQDGISVVDIY